MKYLDPKNDVTFKKVFGEHKHLCRSFLNALLPLADDEQIVDLEYLPAELVPQIPVLRNTIVDVRCVDTKGRQFIVEMQMFWTDSFRQRVLFNASKAYVKQLEKNQKYSLLQPVYALSLVNDIFDKQSEHFYHHYQIVNIENTEEQLKGLEFVFVELPKFKPQSKTEKRLTALWLRYLTEISDGTTSVPNELLSDNEIRQAVECLQESAFSKAELEYYDKYWDTVRVEKTLLDEMLDMGLKKGEEIGIRKGIISVAKNLKDTGMSVDEIAAITGLSKEEIEKL